MKNITYLLLLITCTTSFAQEATSFTEAIELGLIDVSSINATVVKESDIASTNDIITYYPNRAALETACTGTLVLEDFAGGPNITASQGCDGDISAVGDSCFPAGEIQPGLVITSSDTSDPEYMVFTAAGFASNTVDVVGTNQFPSYTILNFTDATTNTVALDFYSLPFGGTVTARVFGETGLLDTVTITDLPGPVFFGFIATEHITKIEFQDSGSFVEMVGQVAFGACGSVASVNELSETAIQYFPNPTTDILTIKSKSNINFVSFINVLGQEVKLVKPLNNTITIDLSDLSAGTYFGKTQVNDRTEIFKIIKK